MTKKIVIYQLDVKATKIISLKEFSLQGILDLKFSSMTFLPLLRRLFETQFKDA